MNEKEKFHPIQFLEAKYLSSFLAIIYLFGFIITQLYLGTFGISNIDVIKLNYLVRGTFFLAYMCLIGALAFIFDKSIISASSSKKNKYSPLANLIFIILIIFAFGLTIEMVTGMTREEIDRITLTRLAYLSKIFYAYLLGYFIKLIITFKKRENLKDLKIRKYRLFYGFLLIIGLKLIYDFILKLIFNSGNLPFFLQQILASRNITNTFLITISLIPFAYIILTAYNDDIEFKIKPSFHYFLEKFAFPFIVLSSAIFLHTRFLFPSISQQIGGGHMIKINIHFDGEDISKKMNEFSQFFLIEKTSEEYILLATNENIRSIYSIPKSKITNIQYLVNEDTAGSPWYYPDEIIQQYCKTT